MGISYWGSDVGDQLSRDQLFGDQMLGISCRGSVVGDQLSRDQLFGDQLSGISCLGISCRAVLKTRVLKQPLNLFYGFKIRILTD